MEIYNVFGQFFKIFRSIWRPFCFYDILVDLNPAKTKFLLFKFEFSVVLNLLFDIRIIKINLESENLRQTILFFGQNGSHHENGGHSENHVANGIFQRQIQEVQSIKFWCFFPEVDDFSTYLPYY